jgi:hypothetical protein
MEQVLLPILIVQEEAEVVRNPVGVTVGVGEGVGDGVGGRVGEGFGV